MFIIKNGLISNDKTIDIGKDRIINLVFKSDLTFADDDKLALNIGGLVSENYAFTQDGCFRFSYVNVSSLITGLENNIAITVTNNGTQILSDTITMYADYSSGSGSGGSIDLSNYATKAYVAENAPIKTTPITLNTVSYNSSQNSGVLGVGTGTSFADSVINETVTFTYTIEDGLQISPNDDFNVFFKMNPKKETIITKLYIDDKLIRQGETETTEINGSSVFYCCSMGKIFHKEVLKNLTGKVLKLQLTTTGILTLLNVILTKNIYNISINNIMDNNSLGQFIYQYTDKQINPQYSQTQTITFNQINRFANPTSNSVPIANLTLNITNDSIYNCTYIFTTADSFTYTANINSTFYLNKPLDLQGGKTYAICQYFKYVFWCELELYGA